MITINNFNDCKNRFGYSAPASSAFCCHSHGSCANIGLGTKREGVDGNGEPDYCVFIG